MMKTVIEMAREAGLLGPYDTEQDIVECGVEVWLFDERGMKAIERFAELARADAIAEEREACAKVCYELPWKDMDCIPSNLAFAAAIRARGETSLRSNT